MSKLKKVNKNDKNRILLSEVLPYEVPIIFSNEGYYDYISNSQKLDFIEELLSKPESRIPFNYRIKKSAFAHRTLSIMHPASQKDAINFYHDYDLLIIHLCNKSPISLRFPSQVAGLFYEKPYSYESYKDPDVDSEIDFPENIKEKRSVCSYFKYRKYDLLLKFYDSYEFVRIEKKFKHLLKFDISNCFNSIYTHSISWAVKDKMFAKQYRNRNSFEKDFDELMQNANHKETNGILIGPEISRIFAEIILQRIDLNVVSILEKRNIRRNRDYDLRRYVDDYFVFINDVNTGHQILKVFEEELEHYKLHINEKKTDLIKVPFISGITIARRRVSKLLQEFFTHFFDSCNFESEEEDIQIKQFFKTRSSYASSNKLILDLKCIVKENQIEYESISRLSLSIVKKQLRRLYKLTSNQDLADDQIHLLTQFLLNIYDFLFFLYSMDNCVRITYVMTQVIVATNKYLKQLPKEAEHNIKKKIFDESIFLIKNIRNEEKVLTVEVLNLLIALKDLGEEYFLEENVLENIIEFDLDNKSLCYFHFIVSLYYVGNNEQYKNVRSRIEKCLYDYFRSETHHREKTESVLLFFDIISCPYVSESCKNSVVEFVFESIKGSSPQENTRNQIKNFIARRNWFVDWSEDINLDYILEKKELTTPY
jgi:hypothetical protein